MRTKSEGRRTAILEAAAEIFQAAGFERASMEDIRARVGCSKPTLYNYFASKEELFFAVMLDSTESEIEGTLATLEAEVGDVEQTLAAFGRQLMTLLYSPRVQAIRRLVMSEAGRYELGKRCYELGPARGETAIATFMQRAIDEGKLRPAHPRIAAVHYKALLEAEWLEPLMYQTLETVKPKQIEQSVERAVAVFMAAYGPQDTKRSGKNA